MRNGIKNNKCKQEMSTVKLVWKNVRKIRTREKQMKLAVWMKENECDVCAIYETGLNGNAYVEVSDEYKWIGTNIDWMRGKTGGVGFVIKSDIECQRIICNSEDICFIKIRAHANGCNWLLGSIYMNCEGIREKGKCIENEVCKRGN